MPTPQPFPAFPKAPAPPPTSVDDELAAMDSVLHTLEPLDQAAQRRALTWVMGRLNPWSTSPTVNYPVAPVPVMPVAPFGDPFHTP